MDDTSIPRAVVAEGYDRVAPRFEEWQKRVVGDPRRRYVARLLSMLPPRADILEIGSGSGVEPTPTLARRGRLIGVDISYEQIMRSRSRVRDGRFLHADIVRSDFAPASFDAVVALFVLTHIPTADLPGLLQRIAQWLRPGGSLLATLGAGGDHEGIVDDWLGVPMFFSGLDPDTNESLVKAAGMVVIESQVEGMQEPDGDVEFHWLLARKPQGQRTVEL